MALGDRLKDNLAGAARMAAHLATGPLHSHERRTWGATPDEVSATLSGDGAEAHAAPVDGAPPYDVRFLTPAPGELDVFRLERFSGVYALGRCTPGEHTYSSVLEDAARLAGELLGEGT